jgi:predicted DNA-binding protein (UPF0251 family)
MSNPVEDELNAIRIELYEQTKNMNTSERVTFIKRQVAEGMRKHNVKAVVVDSLNSGREIHA